MIFAISPLRSISLRKAGTSAPARKWIFGIALATTVTVLSAAPPPDWPMFGQNVSNTASTTSPGNSMSPTTISKLKPKWIFTTGGDVSARAAVVNGVVYFPDWGGNIDMAHGWPFHGLGYSSAAAYLAVAVSSVIVGFIVVSLAE